MGFEGLAGGEGGVVGVVGEIEELGGSGQVRTSSDRRGRGQGEEGGGDRSGFAGVAGGVVGRYC